MLSHEDKGGGGGGLKGKHSQGSFKFRRRFPKFRIKVRVSDTALLGRNEEFVNFENINTELNMLTHPHTPPHIGTYSV